MGDVIALIIFLALIHGVLFAYWKGMGSARKKKFKQLYGRED